MNRRHIFSVAFFICQALTSLQYGHTYAQVDSQRNVAFAAIQFVVTQSETSTTDSILDDSILSASEAIQPISDQYASSVVQVFNEHRHLVYGTVISESGFVVTKLSELGGKPLQCRFNDQHEFPATLVARHEIDDIAILKVQAPAKVFKPIPLKNQPPITAGKFVVSAAPQGHPGRFGIISVNNRSAAIQQPECTDCVDVGITGTPIQFYEPKSTELKSGLLITRVYPRTVAEQCGLLVDDVVQSIERYAVYNTPQFEKYFRSLKPGYGARLTVYRNGQVFKPLIAMPRHSKRIFHDRWGGGPFNRRRFGFRNVIIHDAAILPDECGGPLVDIHGNVIGINIARSLRTSSLAVPVDRIKTYLNSLVEPIQNGERQINGNGNHSVVK